MDSQQRRQSLVELLKNATSPVNVAKLSAALAVSPRTVHNDLSALIESGSKIKSVMGRGGGFWLQGAGNGQRVGVPDEEDSITSKSSSARGPQETRFAHQARFVGRASEYARLEILS